MSSCYLIDTIQVNVCRYDRFIRFAFLCLDGSVNVNSGKEKGALKLEFVVRRQFVDGREQKG